MSKAMKKLYDDFYKEVKKSNRKDKLLNVAEEAEQFYKKNWPEIVDSQNWMGELTQNIRHIKSVKAMYINKNPDLISFKTDLIEAIHALNGIFDYALQRTSSS